MIVVHGLVIEAIYIPLMIFTYPLMPLSKTCLKMYLAVVRPLYAVPVWDPYTSKVWLHTSLERIQKLALRMRAKDWSTSYEDL